MSRLVPLVLVMFVLPLVCRAVEIYLQEDFETPRPGIPADAIVEVPGRGNVLHILLPAGAPNPGNTLSIPLPMDKVRGKQVFFGADVKASNVSARPNAWNGVKVMLVVKTPAGTNYPQPDLPVGSFDWLQASSSGAIPQDATEATLILGLEKVTGEVWFDNVRVSLRKVIATPKPAPADQPIYRGHELPRLRGAMVHPSMTEADLTHFAKDWNGNLIRWQLLEAARQDRRLEDYDVWLDGQLTKLDQVLGWCEKLGVKAVVDLHSPPGGQAFQAGYITARGRLFTQPETQAKFIEVWEKMTKRYKDRDVIWGFDLVNEPDDVMVVEGCLDWNDLALKAARAVHAIDPHRTLIIEPNHWGNAFGFLDFMPLDEPRIVYSYHMYEPHQFTHQGILGNAYGVNYPGVINGKEYNKETLRSVMRPAIDFANKYRMHMYVGEFSAIRNAPDGTAARYLADVTGILEELGYDWSYHAYREWNGWSLEHEGPFDKATMVTQPTDREKVITGWYARNKRP